MVDLKEVLGGLSFIVEISRNHEMYSFSPSEKEFYLFKKQEEALGFAKDHPSVFDSHRTDSKITSGRFVFSLFYNKNETFPSWRLVFEPD